MRRVDLDFRTRDLVRAGLLPGSLFDHNDAFRIAQFVLLPRGLVLALGRLRRRPDYFAPDRFSRQLGRIRKEHGLQSLVLLEAEPGRAEYVILFRVRMPSLLAEWMERTQVDVFPSRALHANPERTRISLLVPPNATKALRAFLDGVGIPFALRIRSRNVSQEDLTPRQRGLLLRALDMGYYDLPAQVKLARLASLAGISKATLSRHLRKAEKRVLVRYFAEEEAE